MASRAGDLHTGDGRAWFNLGVGLATWRKEGGAMQRGILCVLVITIFMSFMACSEGPQSPKPVIGPGVQHNMADLAAMMKELHALMFEGPFTEKEATEVSAMMTQVSAMMKEMSGPEGERLASQHEQKLKEMRRRLDAIRQQIKQQNQPLS
jgi:hypothetical protein